MKVIKITPHPEDCYESLILAWPEQQGDVSLYLAELAEAQAEQFLADQVKRTITVELVDMSAKEVLLTVEQLSDELIAACDEELAEEEE